MRQTGTGVGTGVMGTNTTSVPSSEHTVKVFWRRAVVLGGFDVWRDRGLDWKGNIRSIVARKRENISQGKVNTVSILTSCRPKPQRILTTLRFTRHIMSGQFSK